MLIDVLNLMDYCDVNCLDSHSDGTHSLQRIHWSVSEVMLDFRWKKLIYILDGLRLSTLSVNFDFGLNYFLFKTRNKECSYIMCDYMMGFKLRLFAWGQAWPQILSLLKYSNCHSIPLAWPTRVFLASLPSFTDYFSLINYFFQAVSADWF